jgi:hypothetical protein
MFVFVLSLNTFDGEANLSTSAYDTFRLGVALEEDDEEDDDDEDDDDERTGGEIGNEMGGMFSSSFGTNGDGTV